MSTRTSLLFCAAAIALSTSCRDSHQSVSPDEKYSIGGRRAIVGSAIVSLWRMKHIERSNDYDDALVELLRVQCKGLALPAGVTLNRDT